MCKGDWLLGTACGRCERCYERARYLLPRLVKPSDAAIREGEHTLFIQISATPSRQLAINVYTAILHTAIDNSRTDSN